MSEYKIGKIIIIAIEHAEDRIKNTMLEEQ
jgi:hypothetical protein